MTGLPSDGEPVHAAAGPSTVNAGNLLSAKEESKEDTEKALVCIAFVFCVPVCCTLIVNTPGQSQFPEYAQAVQACKDRWAELTAMYRPNNASQVYTEAQYVIAYMKKGSTFVGKSIDEAERVGVPSGGSSIVCDNFCRPRKHTEQQQIIAQIAGGTTSVFGTGSIRRNQQRCRTPGSSMLQLLSMRRPSRQCSSHQSFSAPLRRLLGLVPIVAPLTPAVHLPSWVHPAVYPQTVPCYTVRNWKVHLLF